MLQGNKRIHAKMTNEGGSSNSNPFREVPLRYMGYANELGESFRPLIPPAFVHLSYVAAFGYVFADTNWVYQNAVKQRQVVAQSPASAVIPAGTAASVPQHLLHASPLASFSPTVQAFDCLLWQTFASVFIPGYVIHSIVKMSGKLVDGADSSLLKKFPAAKTYLPTCIGLASIPLIIHPIDTAVELAMEHTIRKAYPKEK